MIVALLLHTTVSEVTCWQNSKNSDSRDSEIVESMFEPLLDTVIEKDSGKLTFEKLNI